MQKSRAAQFLGELNRVGRNSAVSWICPWYTAFLVGARQSGYHLKDWAYLTPSLTGEVACPSETACCSISSSSVLWWITHVRSGGPLPAATSGSCKCYNPSVFALRLTHLGTVVTGKFTWVWGFHSSPTTLEHCLRVSTQVSWCGEVLCSATWKTPVPTKLKSPTGNRGGLMFSRSTEAVPKKATKSAKRVVSNYSATLTEVFRAFPQLSGKVHWKIQKGHCPPSPIIEAFSRNDFPPPPGRRGHQPKRSQHFWVQLPESHPTKILFSKDKLPDGIISHQ
jgi:hypothetical protein